MKHLITLAIGILASGPAWATTPSFYRCEIEGDDSIGLGAELFVLQNGEDSGHLVVEDKRIRFHKDHWFFTDAPGPAFVFYDHLDLPETLKGRECRIHFEDYWVDGDHFSPDEGAFKIVCPDTEFFGMLDRTKESFYRCKKSRRAGRMDFLPEETIDLAQ